MLREGKAPAWERLITTLFLAALVHGLFIIGVTFNAAAEDKGSAPGLEVLLVSDELTEAHQNADATYLAQRTQLGSGNTREHVKPHNRASAIPAPQHAGSREGDSLAASGDLAGNHQERVLTTTAWNTEVRYVADLGDSGSLRTRPLLLEQRASAPPGSEEASGPAELRGPQRDELWITPDTRVSVLAPYLDAWRRKVERIGTRNFPVAARTSRATSSPLVAVTIAADGSIREALIRRSSGDPELDQAALATLKLASHFDPFPPELAARYHVLHFAYEWQFTGGRGGSGAVTALP